MEILPQTTQDNQTIFLLDENIAICENGKILYYDDLGHLHDTNYECVLDEITPNTPTSEIKTHIIDLENIFIGEFVINLVANTIDNEHFSFLDDNTILFREYCIDLDTLEVVQKPCELEAYDEDSMRLELAKNPPSLYLPDVLSACEALMFCIYRQNIENYVPYTELVRKLAQHFSL